MAETAAVIGALAAVGALSVGALYFAWRTVVEARRAHVEDKRDPQLVRFEMLGVALTELAAALNAGGIAPGRVIQARASALWNWKERLVWRSEFETLDQAREEIANCIETYHHRPHSCLRYRTPAEVRQTWEDGQRLAKTAA